MTSLKSGKPDPILRTEGRSDKIDEIRGEVKTGKKKQNPTGGGASGAARAQPQRAKTRRGDARSGDQAGGGPSFLPDRREAPGLAMLVLASMKKSSGSWMYSVKARDLHRPRTWIT